MSTVSTTLSGGGGKSGGLHQGTYVRSLAANRQRDGLTKSTVRTALSWGLRRGDYDWGGLCPGGLYLFPDYKETER